MCVTVSVNRESTYVWWKFCIWTYSNERKCSCVKADRGVDAPILFSVHFLLNVPHQLRQTPAPCRAELSSTLLIKADNYHYHAYSTKIFVCVRWMSTCFHEQRLFVCESVLHVCFCLCVYRFVCVLQNQSPSQLVRRLQTAAEPGVGALEITSYIILGSFLVPHKEIYFLQIPFAHTSTTCLRQCFVSYFCRAVGGKVEATTYLFRV